MIEIKLYPKTPDEVRLTAQFLDALAEATAAAGPTPAAEATAAPGAADAPGSPEADVGDGEDGDIPFPPFDAPPPSSPQEVLAALQDYARTAGAGALKELLDRFGARRVSDIKPKHHAEVLALIRGEAAP